MAPSPLLVLYGGTFDPFHNGHLAIARCARDELSTTIRLMPAADPPHRAPPGANAQQRAAMLELAVADEAGLVVDLRELVRASHHPGVPSWTVETLRQLRAEIGMASPVALLIGADSLLGLPGWHEWEQLLDLAHLVVADRPGSPLDGELPAALTDRLQEAWTGSAAELLQSPAGRVLRLHQPLQAESATAVRSLIGSGGAWRDLVPANVANFIIENRLYGCQSDS